MKRLLLLLLGLPLVLVSCLNEGPKSADVVGTWVRESISPYTVITDNEAATDIIEVDINSYNKEERDSYRFFENGRVLFVDSRYADDGLYHRTDSALVFSYPTGETIVVPASVEENVFSLYNNETEYYQDWINYLFPNKNIEVLRVITEYSYKKRSGGV